MTDFSPDQTFTVDGPTFWEHVQRWDHRRLYALSAVYTTYMQSAGLEIDTLHASVYDTLAQFFVDTATWGLPRWESEMGLVPRPGAGLQERREALRARLRGLGTATLKLIKSIGEAYLGGQLDLVEDHTAYNLIINFVDIRGVPINLADVQAALRAIVPAHLTLQFNFRYTTWDSVDAADLTWDEVDALGLTWDQWDVQF